PGIARLPQVAPDPARPSIEPAPRSLRQPGAEDLQGGLQASRGDAQVVDRGAAPPPQDAAPGLEDVGPSRRDDPPDAPGVLSRWPSHPAPHGRYLPRPPHACIIPKIQGLASGTTED